MDDACHYFSDKHHPNSAKIPPTQTTVKIIKSSFRRLCVPKGKSEYSGNGVLSVRWIPTFVGMTKYCDYFKRV
jgi:hypothetical protein